MQRIRVSPAAAVRLPRPDVLADSTAELQEVVNPFTLAELLEVVESQRNRPHQHEGTKRYADVTLALGLTGVRLGELAALRVDRLDISRARLTISESVTLVRNEMGLVDGANVKAVQQMLGHASAAMTLDIYAGLFPDHLDAVALALDGHVPQMCHNGMISQIEAGGEDDPNAA